MMTDERTGAIQIFFCYAPEDQSLLDQLKMHLSPLQRRGFIDIGSDHTPGTAWKHNIIEALNTAKIALLLISANFMESDFCYKVGMKRALERHERGEALVIPILVRSCSWEGTPLAQFDILPRNRIPIVDFEDPDEAFCEIAKELRYRVENLLINRWRDEASEFYRQGRYSEALAAYERILRLKNSLAASIDRASVLNDLQRYQETLDIYDKCMQALNSGKTSLSTRALDEDRPEPIRKFYEEALQVYEQLFQRSPSYDSHTQWPGMMREDAPLWVDGAQQVLLDRLDQAIDRNPINPFLYHLKGNVCFRLGQYREALGAYEQAIQLQKGFELSRRYFSETMENIGRQEYQKLSTLARRDLEKANRLRDKREH